MIEKGERKNNKIFSLSVDFYKFVNIVVNAHSCFILIVKKILNELILIRVI